MKAYKFRSVEDLERVRDILINRRLYCGDVRNLNDIREADIRVGHDRGREAELFEFGFSVTRAISDYRVCSLSKTFNNYLLWAHYAGGSSGLAIEVALPSPDALDVTYDDDFIFLSDYVDAGVDAAVRACSACNRRVATVGWGLESIRTEIASYLPYRPQRNRHLWPDPSFRTLILSFELRPEAASFPRGVMRRAPGHLCKPYRIWRINKLSPRKQICPCRSGRRQ